jgi:hypothetical protein
MLFKNITRGFIDRFKKLSGDPHYVGMGMAIGVFIGVTPTFPFHTTIALALATMLRGSRPAAALGVWFGNPVTMPLFYAGSYKAGMLLMGKSVPAIAFQQQSMAGFLELGLDVTCAMMLGGALIGAIPCVAAYFFTRKMVSALRSR